MIQPILAKLTILPKDGSLHTVRAIHRHGNIRKNEWYRNKHVRIKGTARPIPSEAHVIRDLNVQSCVILIREVV
jgi:hypothetical protein